MLNKLFLGIIFWASIPFKRYQNISECNTSSLELHMNKENTTPTKIKLTIFLFSDLPQHFTKNFGTNTKHSLTLLNSRPQILTRGNPKH